MISLLWHRKYFSLVLLEVGTHEVDRIAFWLGNWAKDLALAENRAMKMCAEALVCLALEGPGEVGSCFAGEEKRV